jgi:hypothetical protein
VAISSNLLNDCLDGLLRREMFLIEKQSPHLTKALDTIMDNARPMPAYHRHSCDCGDFFVCTASPDVCPQDWTCPSCLERQMDEFFQNGDDRADHR